MNSICRNLTATKATMHLTVLPAFDQLKQFSANPAGRQLLKVFIYVILLAPLCAFGQSAKKTYQLWYDQPVPDLPITNKDSLNTNALIEATPLDPAWENWSLPIGNGYLGACLFGRTVTERIQLTENSMAARSLYGGVGLTNFAELYIDFNHANPQYYRRSLNLDEAISTVQYEQDGVMYKRTYFASYPDKIMIIKLSANKAGKLSFTMHPQIPYKKEFGQVSNNNGRRGKVTSENDLITLAGKMEWLNLLFEAQFKVIPFGGSLKAVNDVGDDNGRIIVTGADSAIILIAVGTNYQLEPHVFTENNPAKKIRDTSSPHRKVTEIISAAATKNYAQLISRHTKDYTGLYSRVALDLGSTEPALPTDQLLKNYKAGNIDHYLEELYFQYGRYLLICSSRPGTLPSNLQGIWSQYDITPWTGGYWHNINVQMNYWPVFNTNLTELFQSFADYNIAYREAAAQMATRYLKVNNPSMLSSSGDNGWTIGTGASAYNISGPGQHSGPGTGGLTTKLFYDYYAFTGDTGTLKNIAYPAMLGMSKFLSKVVIDTAGWLLTAPSYSPEQRWKGREHYRTTGSAFDQQMIYENHRDVIQLAKKIKDNSHEVKEIAARLPRLDPVQVGWSGQVKEYREEKQYGEIGDPKHRHISHLVGLYPGTIINATTPAWLDAARVTLELRGDQSTGWAMAFRLNCWARVKDGNRSYRLLQTLLKKGTADNLWDMHPPFQIDGNFGGTAGIAEMLLQSHEGYIHLLPSLPTAWDKGSFNGLLARGNFEVAARWENGQASNFIIKSIIGGKCTLKYINIGQAIIENQSGKKLQLLSRQRDIIEFQTRAGDIINIRSIPLHKEVAIPADLQIVEAKKEQVRLQWSNSKEAVAYHIYQHLGNAPTYQLVKRTSLTSYGFTMKGLQKHLYGIIKVTALDASGRESEGVRVKVEYQ